MLHLQHNKVMRHIPSLKSSFEKTLKVIESCTTKEQLKGASKMIRNFEILYGKIGFVKFLNYRLVKEYNNKKVNLWK